MCGVSRTPVRDALRRLEAEMLVRRTDTQRTFVPDWSIDEVEEIFTLRALLEGHAAARAARFISDEQIQTLREYNLLLDDAINDSRGLDTEAFVANNRLFHNALLTAARSERLVKMRAMLVEQTILHRTARNYDEDGLRRSHADHEELVLALEARDADWARSIMVGHIRHAYHVTARGLDRDREDEAENPSIPQAQLEAARKRRPVALR